MESSVTKGANLLLSSALGKPLSGTDGVLGQVVDFYFDDHQWDLQYVICRCPGPRGRNNYAFPASDLVLREGVSGVPGFFVPLAKDDLVQALRADEVPPVSVQMAPHITDVVSGSGTYGPWSAGGLISHWPPSTQGHGNPHLRSYKLVRTYDLRSVQGQLGRIHDFIVTSNTWTIACLSVKVGHLLARKPATLRPAQITRIQWTQRAVWTGVYLFEL